MYTLENLKLLLDLKDDTQDALLSLIMAKIENALLIDLQVDCLNKKTEIIAMDLCVQQYFKIKKARDNNGDISVTNTDNAYTHKSIY